MESHFVKALFDLDCRWEGLPPSYRIYVNDELFAERSFWWTDCHLLEILQIQAPPGIYKVRVENLGPVPAEFVTAHHRVAAGPGRWLDDITLEIIEPPPPLKDAEHAST